MQEVVGVDRTKVFDQLAAYRADILVGSVSYYPKNLQHVLLFNPQFVWEFAIIGRETLSQPTTGSFSGIIKFYSPEWLLILTLLMMFVTIISMARNFFIAF